MESGDLERVLVWRNHSEISRFMFTQHEITLEEHCNWFERASTDPHMRLLIVEEKGESLGFVKISGVAVGSVADWGFYVAPEAQKGSGRKLGITALNFAFQDLALHKVCGQALGFNEASIRFHRSLGFRDEGLLRDQHRIGSTYYDLICFGLLSHEWPLKESR